MSKNLIQKINWAFADAYDAAQARPCSDNEAYPDKCTDEGGGGAGPKPPPQQQSWEPSPFENQKLFRKMDNKGPKEGVGIQPSKTDPQRDQRTLPHTQALKAIQPHDDAKRAAYQMSKMFPGSQQSPSETGGFRGQHHHADEKEARRSYDDANHAFQQAGWQKTSETPGSSSWTNGHHLVRMQHGRTPKGFGTQYRIEKKGGKGK